MAVARKLAVIYYQMMTDKTVYNPQALSDYQEKYNKRKIKNLEKYLEKMKATAEAA